MKHAETVKELEEVGGGSASAPLPRANDDVGGRNSLVVVEETSGVRLLYNHLATVTKRYIDRQRVGDLEWSRD